MSTDIKPLFSSLKQWEEDVFDGIWQFVGPGLNFLRETNMLRVRYYSTLQILECQDFYVIFSTFRIFDLWLSFGASPFEPQPDGVHTPCHQRARLKGSKVQVPYSNISGWFLVLWATLVSSLALANVQ